MMILINKWCEFVINIFCDRKEDKIRGIKD